MHARVAKYALERQTDSQCAVPRAEKINVIPGALSVDCVRDYSLFAACTRRRQFSPSDSFGTHGAFGEFVSGFRDGFEGPLRRIRERGGGRSRIPQLYLRLEGNLPQWSNCRKLGVDAELASRGEGEDYVLSRTQPDAAGPPKSAVNPRRGWKEKCGRREYIRAST